MVADLLTETLVPFAKATTQLPGSPHATTLFRWRTRGVRGQLLESCLIGGRRFTSLEALERFVEAITTANGEVLTPSRRRLQQLERVDRELDEVLGRPKDPS